MAMSLVDGGVGREKVEILVALDVPDMDTLSTGQRNRYGLVVVAAELLLPLEDLLRAQRLDCRVTSESRGESGSGLGQHLPEETGFHGSWK